MKIYNSRDRLQLMRTVEKLGIFTKEELCFYDDSPYRGTLPEWAVTQMRINKIREKRAMQRAISN